MPSVAEVVARIEKAGLVVRQNPSKGSHTLWDVVDPSTGTILTGISAHADRKGGDRNWHFQIRRILRKAGFQIEFGEVRKKKNRAGHKRKPAIDLEALKIAQDKAIAAGVRPPLLEDIEGDRSFLTRNIHAGGSIVYTEEATGEVIDTMPIGTDAPRVHATVARLKKFMELRGPELSKRARDRHLERNGHLRGFRPGGSVNSEFVRTAIEEVAPQRGIKAWASLGSGQQTVHSLLKKENAGASLWVVNLLDATMDHLEGMKWNEIDPTRIKQVSEPSEDLVGASEAGEVVTPPQEGPDQTTYDVAIEIIDEYEEVFRKIAETAGADGTDPDDWKAVTHKAQAANLAVMYLRKEYDELSKRVETHRDGILLETNPISDQYASVLLDLLKNFEVERQGNGMLDLIFTRLDKLAGI